MKLPGIAFLLTLLALLWGGAPAAEAAPRTVHVFVALADNRYQGIVPVPAAIGDGDDAAGNLYWGCDEGVRSIFRHSPRWRLVYAQDNPSSAVLERLVFRHTRQEVYLIADAYRGREIRRAITDFLAAAAGSRSEQIRIDTAGKPPLELAIAGGASLAAYIGHDGLMDFSLEPAPPPRTAAGKPAIVLCCKSRDYFLGPLRQAGARPLLLTTQLMYPGAFILESALEGWLAGESAEAIRDRAARAYAANQRIGFKSARGVFSSGAPATGHEGRP